MTTFNTDKITLHNYYPVYQMLASQLGEGADVCEVGVLDGESLKMWQHMFPKGTVTGVDYSINAIWPEGTIKVISDQTSPQLPDLLTEYDLIVEDASHEGWKTKETFRLLWPLVRSGGFYVVEDWAVGLADHPNSPYHAEKDVWGTSMLSAAESFLKLLPTQNSECDYITYAYGLIIIHRS
jgi:cephalosporin hydroxylase